ncbi:BQ5605_C001g00449 [Microbotryum silenes-dioicae]|uniref:BQ5605_C001g00449 protein n=1 Tax=Microbotryum silenes-dioicae TaxID=796604 RepID=A0A2X0M6T0_9BASI|nr:BQ5605_C001g00449 [Microbotryum silenes-dioicae]
MRRLSWAAILQTEYWISKDRYWCKQVPFLTAHTSPSFHPSITPNPFRPCPRYCSIYIADDKPSRIHHETGLKHKGHYERYIREIYKRGEREKREKKEEADEMARIEKAARLAMGSSSLDLGDRTSSTPHASTSKPTPAGPPDPFASYTTAADLGFKDEPVIFDPAIEAREKDKETRQTEGVIGQWEVVKKKKPLSTTSGVTTMNARVVPPPPQWMQNSPGYTNGVKVENEGKQEGEDEQGAEHEEPEQEQPKAAPKYLNEKAYATDEDDYNPSNVGPVKLKRKILTLKEQQEIDEREREKKMIKEEIEKTRKRAKLERGNGWSQVEAGDEGLLEFEEPPEAEGEVKQEEGNGAKPSVAEEEQDKLKVASGFKKRKMHGANAVRKKQGPFPG